jgi:hypothetical protein
MDTFATAFDIVIVGALALPCVLLVIHLFLSENESRLEKVVAWVKAQDQPALVSVLLFAMAYPVGSAVSRIAQDFFDDDDLHVHLFHHLFRVGVTESSIRTDVFCNTFKQEPPDTTPASSEAKSDAKPELTASNPPVEKHEALKADSKNSDLAKQDVVKQKDERFRTLDPQCVYTGRWIIQTHTRDPVTHQRITSDWIAEQEGRAGDVFKVHEAAILLKGTDPNERLRQYHDQIMVLRGAGFDGIVAFSLCLFWWASRFHSSWRWYVLLPYLAPGIVASVNHFSDHAHDPPYMEFTFLVLTASGGWLLWQRQPRRKGAHGEPRVQNGKGEVRVAYLVIALFLTVSALLGWWATQVLYDQQVVYSYKSLGENPPGPAASSKN